MNAFMGSRKGYGPVQGKQYAAALANYPAYYEKESDLQSPSQLWVLIEEDERTIADGAFMFDPLGKEFIDSFPASSANRHNYGFSLVFGDGHAEIWRFRNPNIVTVSTISGDSSGPINKDFERLGRATAVPRN